MARTLTIALALCAAASLPLAARAGRRAPDVPATPKPASNMGFNCGRHFPTVPDFQNIYLVAVPDFFGQSDIADSSQVNPCGGTPDGVINADDVLCDWWTSRQGSMTLSRRDETTETWQSRMASADDATGDITFSGGWTAPLPAREAFFLTVTPPATGPVDNVARIVGSHDGTDTGHVLSIPASGNDLVTLLNVPYHTMYRRAVELVCGLEGVDFVDADGDHLPDGGQCPLGLMSGQTGAVSMQVATFDDSADGATTDDTWVTFEAQRDPVLGTVTFTGTNFDLEVIHAYLVTVHAPCADATFLSPHF